MAERLSLLEELRTGRFEVSVATTYSIDFQFYEAVVLRRLIAAGCEHHLLVVDAARCAEALTDPDRRPRLAGLAYALVPVAYSNAFHPKVILQLGKKSGRCFVGSHNVTFPGFGGNAEVTTRVVGDGKSGEERDLIGSALEACQRWVEQGGSHVGRQVIERAWALAPWLKRARGASPAFLWSGEGRPALWDQLVPTLPAQPKRVLVVGPFFDQKLEFLRRVARDLQPEELVVAIDPGSAMINVGPGATVPARYVDIRGTLDELEFAESSDLHAKALLVEHAAGTMLVSGSANPSAAAWLAGGTNAEAVTVRRDISEDDIDALALRRLFDAPEITSAQWADIAGRVSAERQPDEEPPLRAQVATAVESGGQVTVQGVRGAPTEVLVHLRTSDDPTRVPWREEGGALLLDSTESVRLQDCSLIEVAGPNPTFAVVDHLDALAPSRGGASVQGDLVAAMNGAYDDPSHLEEVMRIVEKAIFDEDVESLTRATRPSVQSAPAGEITTGQPLGPRAVRLEDIKRRGKVRRVIADGNIAVIIDLLVRRIAEGLPASGPEPPPEVEEKDLEALGEAARAAAVSTDGATLLKALHRKVRKLLDRMTRRVKASWEAEDSPVATIVQLAAVLGVVRWLRRVERGLSWMPFGASALPEEALLNFFWWTATYVGASPGSLVERAQVELGDEPAEEVSIALGLLAWVGFETGTDLRALKLHPDVDEQDEFHWAGHLARLLRLVAEDDRAVGVLKDVLVEFGGKRGTPWLAAHLPFAETFALAAMAPESAPTARREVRRGDLARVVLQNGAASVGFVVDVDDTKVWLSDPERDEGRPVLRKHVAAVDVALPSAGT